MSESPDGGVVALLKQMVGMGASDLHLKVGNKPGYRIDGRIEPLPDHEPLSASCTKAFAQELMTPEQWARFEKERDLDFGHAIEGFARFRVNVLTQQSNVGLVIRQIPDEVPSAEKLGLPDICMELAAKPRGLVLVTGPTGSGKSTTLAAMLDYVNRTRSGHILTMEDPVEFVHQDKKCFVTQRQIGHDCASFGEALRRALRQDPDVILIGEMRDLETISLAISAAETGHLVFGTLHTTSAISTVDRIVDVFPPDQQMQVRVQLASSIQGVISQCLIKRPTGGRIAAHEILVGTDAVKSLVRDGKTAQLLNQLQTGAKFGMRTLESVLIGLAKDGSICPSSAVSKANRPDDVLRAFNEAGIKIPKADEDAPAGAGAGAAGGGAAAAAPARPGRPSRDVGGAAQQPANDERQPVGAASGGEPRERGGLVGGRPRRSSLLGGRPKR